MMEQENLDSMILMENDTTMEILQNISCDDCKNIMCFNESDYAEYESWVSVDEFEMFAISLNIIVFVAGIMGNLLVSMASYGIKYWPYLLEMEIYLRIVHIITIFFFSNRYSLL